ncbi:phage integrase family protein [Streptomyces brevispora]|uniref:Phage integrase family protein n=1 Tax=Streptomyces brevispora TaxID=887462 RepID=A0A561TTY0_9ACTN|nr:phage integrase family protein [Streptomyces brevispora]
MAEGLPAGGSVLDGVGFVRADDLAGGLVIYGFRHFFASNCLSNRIPITDVAEWMGHTSIDVTFNIYRHLMPGSIGKAAKLLDVGMTS